MTRRILYGNIHATQAADGSLRGEDDLEALFNDDEAEIKDNGPETLTRRSAARMEAFLASCSAALREDNIEDIENIIPTESGSKGGTKSERTKNTNTGKKGAKESQAESLNEKQLDTPSNGTRARAMSNSSLKSLKTFRQINHGDLMLRLDLYCRT